MGRAYSVYSAASVLALLTLSQPTAAQSLDEYVDEGGSETVYVTARRVQEDVQDVPIPVSGSEVMFAP